MKGPNPMRLIALPLATVLVAASCSAQINIGGKKIDFGVKRQKPPTAQVTLLNPASYTAGSRISLQLKIANLNDTKGISVYMQRPCQAVSDAQKVSENVYKLDITIDHADIDGHCQITLRGLAENDGATVEVPYTQDHAQHQQQDAAAEANIQQFAAHKNWIAKTSKGSSYSLQQSSVQPIPAQDGPSGVAVMLKDPKLPVPSMLTIEAPNKVRMTRLGCLMEGTFSGSSASLKRTPITPESACPDGDVTLQAQ
jgi:hypothetical protein